jgi:hypothetical protein
MNIIELAKQAGFQDADWNYAKGLEKFAALVAAHEREACAKECEHTALPQHCEWMAQYCAEAIRARGTT